MPDRPASRSSLGDILTVAVADGADFDSDALGPRYRLRGNKMWISGGEHDLTENIVHLALAKIPGPDGKPIPGPKGISLFVVPRLMVDGEGRSTGERNDVALAGLNHKLGYRGIPNTLLNFGEGRFALRAPGGFDGKGAGAIGYRVGEPGQGLQLMFRMMNEARINVGMGATMLGYAGYLAALDYARNRPQGRSAGPRGKDGAAPQVPILEHADVKRMLLAQKAYAEGGLALGLYCARLVDEKRTGSVPSAQEAARLLEVLTPVAKSWPSEWCLEAEQPRHPGARRLRLHARLRRRAVLARQPAQHDSRRHAWHPEPGSARTQGGGRSGPGACAVGVACARHR